MFQNAEKFNADITRWEISPGTVTALMFQNAKKFDKRWCNPAWHGKISTADFRGSLGMHKCCTAGSYNILQSTSPFIVCDTCPKGTFTNKLNIDTNCSSCPTGWHQDEVEKQYCLPCDPGKMQDEQGQGQCKDCQIGQFVSRAKATSCDDCSVKLIKGGSYQDEEGQTWCKWCLPGKWSDKSGLKNSMGCTTCRAGRWSEADGAKEEDKCCKFKVFT